MAQKTKVGNRALPCPRCGYDLRASPRVPAGVRCSECGTITPLAGPGALTASRVPWVHRHLRGRFRSFTLTVWLVVAKPWLLAREVEVHAHLRDGRLFRAICLGLATLGATACLMIAMGQWNADGSWWSTATRFPPLVPSAILQDHWYGAVPVAGAIFAAFWLCLDLYRTLICLGGGPGGRGEPRHVRRRLAGLSLYSAALLLLETVLLGPLWIIWAPLASLHAHRGQIAEFCVLTLATVAIGIYLWASLSLVLRTGRWRAFRAVLIGIYPVGACFLWITVVTAINWAVGFVVLGVRSITT